MRDPKEKVFDLARAEVCVQLLKGRSAAEGAVFFLKPGGSLLASAENVLSLCGDPTDAKQPVGLVSLEAPLSLAPGESAGRDVQQRQEILLPDVEG